MQSCRKCNQELTDKNWYPSFKKRNSKICKACQNIGNEKWRANNKDKLKIHSSRRYRNHREYTKIWMRNNRKKIRKEMIVAYGGKCKYCGIDDFDILDVDHINNNGGEDRKKGMYGWRLYRKLRKENYPTDNYQLLCKNCNWKKEIMRRRKQT